METTQLGQQSRRKAVVILSGGLDSATCMGIAEDDGYSLHPITFDYGQRHIREIKQAQLIADYYGAAERMKIIALPFLKEFGASALTDEHIQVPRTNVQDSMENEDETNAAPTSTDDEIPVTYVPGRNLMFLSIAASYAEAIGAEAVFIGVNALDYSGYPDCRPEFIEQVQRVIRAGTKAGAEGKEIQIKAPLLHWSKAEIIREGLRLKVPYHLTTSCYNGEEAACGECDSCRLRLKGFKEAGAEDPIPYMKRD